jgi:hypothetical protein
VAFSPGVQAAPRTQHLDAQEASPTRSRDHTDEGWSLRSVALEDTGLPMVRCYQQQSRKKAMGQKELQLRPEADAVDTAVLQSNPATHNGHRILGGGPPGWG